MGSVRRGASAVLVGREPRDPVNRLVIEAILAHPSSGGDQTSPGPLPGPSPGPSPGPRSVHVPAHRKNNRPIAPMAPG